jgi:hypothetical protein
MDSAPPPDTKPFPPPLAYKLKHNESTVMNVRALFRKLIETRSLDLPLL